MKKIRNAVLSGALVGSLAFCAFPAHAQNVTVDGAPVALTLYDTVDGTDGVEKEVSYLSIYGEAGADMLLIHADDRDVYVNKDELVSALPDLDLTKFPSVDEMSALAAANSQDTIKSVQEYLIAQGYMDGTADGIFGAKSREALSTFQAHNGLNATGEVDMFTLLIINAVRNGLEEDIVVSAKPFSSPEEKFPEIASRTSEDLMPFLDGQWRYRFDVFEENGTIDPGISLGGFSVADKDIDRITGEVSLKVLITKAADNSFVLTPAVVVDTVGAYRPYLQEVILTGENTVHLNGASSTSSIEGIFLKENGYIPLTKEALELLDSGTIRIIRVHGKNNSYDMANLHFDKLKVKSFVEACETLI